MTLIIPLRTLKNRRRRLASLVCLPLFILGGCGFPTVSNLVEGLNHQNDLELVCDGSSSYLLLVDSLLVRDPNDIKLLVNATKTYSAYTTVIPECGRPERSAVLSEKARGYGLRLLKETTGIKQSDNLEQISKKLQAVDRGDLEAVFWGAYGWARWITYQQGAPAAVIDLPRLELLMQRIIELDETFYNGGAHLFMGIYHTLKPVAYGGDPEASRRHFDKALKISGRRFLPIQVAYAEHYARMVLDRELYRNLLEEVLAFDLSSAPEMTLSNLIARKQAKRLLEDTDNYF
ncbi:MAG: TRAP transporter TatT component family protein [Desulfobulbales bacterium]|nr:TRAP transporter TatT component family protein [Desulfobulbales bacterium]